MNRIDTPGYFIKRLRDRGYIVMPIFDKYAPEDSRIWTICVTPDKESIFSTCYKWVDEFKILFEINDGGNKWPRNFYLKTSSVNVVLDELKEKEITVNDVDSPFYKERK
jgi:hypothetical protein